jgi:hypothetical protein
VDYYPYHLAIGHRKHWPKYREGASPHSQWLDQALAAFRNSFLDVIDQSRVQHTPLVRTQVAQQEPSKTGAASDSVHHHPQQQQQQHQAQVGIRSCCSEFEVLHELRETGLKCQNMQWENLVLMQCGIWREVICILNMYIS